MHSFEVHSNESVCRKSGCLGLEQVIRDHFKQRQAECKGALLSTPNMGKNLHKLFKAVVNEISQALPILGESGSEASYFIP